MISGTNWYGRGLNERRPAHRNGAALLRSNNRAASKRIRLAVGSPTTSGFGGEKDVDFRVALFQRQKQADRAHHLSRLLA